MREKIGYEFESYNHNDDFSTIKHRLNVEYGLPFIKRVKSDGSLSNGGYEINSDVFHGIEEFKSSFIKMRDAIEDVGHDSPRSPAAIHFHISNIPRPQNFFLIANSYYLLFKKIVDLNESNINFRGPQHNFTKTKEEATNRESFEKIISRSSIDGFRGSVIRRTRYSLEFRPIPTRLDKDYLETWLQIYETILNKSQSMSINDCYKEYKKMQPLNTALDFFELEKKHLKILGGKKYLFEEGEKGDFFKTLSNINVNWNYDWAVPIMDKENPIHVWMYNSIYRREDTLNSLDPVFLFEKTHVMAMYKWCLDNLSNFEHYPTVPDRSDLEKSFLER